MQLDAPEVHDPRQPRGVVDHDLLGGAPGGERQRRRPQPVRPRARARASGRTPRPSAPSTKRLSTIGRSRMPPQRAGRDREVVADDVELGELRLPREVGLRSGCVTRTSRPSIARTLRCLFRRHEAEATSRVMADTKQDVLDMLRELAELTMLDEGDPQSFRVRAYESAAQAISAQATDLGELTAQGAAADRGHRQEHRGEDPRAAREREGREARGAPRRSTRRASSRCCASRGSGRRRSSGCAPSWACSRSTICGAALADAPAAGAQGVRRRSRRRSWPRRSRGSRRRGRSSGRRSRWRCRSPSGSWRACCEVPGVTHASYCGSLRRFSETIGDVDIVVAAAKPPRR